MTINKIDNLCSDVVNILPWSSLLGRLSGWPIDEEKLLSENNDGGKMI